MSPVKQPSQQEETQHPPAAPAPGQRRSELDWLKACGIVLVVLGHCPLPDGLSQWMYTFHVPLFFYAGGALLGSGSQHKTWAFFIRTRLGGLLRQYLPWALFGVVFLALWRHQAVMQMGLGKYLATKAGSVAYGSGHLDYPNPFGLALFPTPLWFLPCYMAALTLMFLLQRATRNTLAQLGTGVLLLPLGLQLGGHPLPFGLETALCAVFWLVLGSQSNQPALAGLLRRPLAPVAALLGLGAATMASLYCGKTDYMGAFLETPLASSAAALVLLVSLHALALRLPRLRLVESIARTTVPILALHIPLLILYKLVLRTCVLPHWPLSPLTSALLFTGACLPLVLVLKRGAVAARSLLPATLR